MIDRHCGQCVCVLALKTELLSFPNEMVNWLNLLQDGLHLFGILVSILATSLSTVTTCDACVHVSFRQCKLHYYHLYWYTNPICQIDFNVENVE